jgi:hypothetical protein
VGFDKNDNRFESVYSQKVKAGKRRTYFFDVRKTKGADFYVTITESTKRFEDDSYSRHKIFLYKEDFNRFVDSLSDVVDHIKNELLPEYDYDEFSRRHEERERLYKESQANESFESYESSDAPDTNDKVDYTDDSDADVGGW